MPSAEEQWLARNTIECKPYEARISPAACVTYQQHKNRIKCPCAEAVREAKPLPKQARRRPTGLNHWLDTGKRLELPATEGQRSVAAAEPEIKCKPYQPQVRTPEERRPRAKGQGPRAKGQGPRAKGQGPRG